MICSRCGMQNSEGARFCSNCGQSLAPQAALPATPVLGARALPDPIDPLRAQVANSP